MRVVLLTHSYPRWPGDFAGAAQGALARALVRRGMSVRVVVPSEDSAGRAELEGVVVDRVRVARAAAEALRDPDALATRLRRPLAWASLLRVWRSLRIAARRQVAAGADVVHAHWWIPSGLATPRGVPVVLTIHGADAGLLQRSRLARTLAQPLWRRTTLVTAVSPEVGDSVQILAGRSMPAEHIQPMPIETKGLRGPAAVTARYFSGGSTTKAGSSLRSKPLPSWPPQAMQCRSPSLGMVQHDAGSSSAPSNSGYRPWSSSQDLFRRIRPAATWPEPMCCSSPAGPKATQVRRWTR